VVVRNTWKNEEEQERTARETGRGLREIDKKEQTREGRTRKEKKRLLDQGQRKAFQPCDCTLICNTHTGFSNTNSSKSSSIS
jgi:hypothetical protein